MAECMDSYGIPESIIEETIKGITVEEGKYPERQAYNKDGWLVTFPSKEYRDRAIQRGTHFTSDPTHGKGGMNLYYKRKGKQKRQAVQDPSQTGEQPAQPAQPVQQGQPASTTDAATQSVAPEKGSSQEPAATEPEKSTASKTGAEAPPAAPDQGGQKASAPDDSELPASSPDDKSQAPSEPESKPAAPAAGGSVPQQPKSPPPPPFVELSKKFAAQKAWASTPYGEWRDSQGNSVAVEALSGEIVPLKSIDREELKIFVQKHTPV